MSATPQRQQSTNVKNHSSSENDVAASDIITSNDPFDDLAASVADASKDPTDDLVASDVHASRDSVDAPQGWRFALLYACILASMFFVGYDTSCIETLIPVITDDFHALHDLGWYIVAYLLPQSATLLIYGQLYSFCSMKGVFIASQFVFVIGNVLSAAAPTSLAFIVGRALSGLGAAGILAGTNIIIANTTALEHRPVYFAITGGVETTALAFGPLVSGTIAHYSTWRVSIYIMIPFGILGMLVFFLAVGDIPPPGDRNDQGGLKSIDWAGFAVNVPMVFCLVMALQWGGITYAWHDSRVILLLTFAGILIVLFLFLEYRAGDGSLVPLKMLHGRTVACASLITFCNFAHLSLLACYLPIYFQAIHGANTIGSGIMYLPTALALGVAVLASGPSISYLGYYNPVMILGGILMPVGAGLITTFTPETRSEIWISYQIIYGIGVGLSFQPPFIAVQTVLEDSLIPMAMGMLNFTQMLGGIVVLSIAQNVFLSRLASNLATGVPGLDPSSILNHGALGLVDAVPERFRGLVLEAYNDALVQVFYISLGLTCVVSICSLVIEWRSVKGKKVEGSIRVGEESYGTF